MAALNAPLFASQENLHVINSMINTSHRSPMLLGDVLPWDEMIDRSAPPKLASTSWIYGTKYWEQLTEAQRLEVLWLENARDVSFFIQLEQFLPPMYMSYLTAFGAALAPEIEEYMMIFAKEEIVHTQMFRRYLEKANLPNFVIPQRPGFAHVMHTLEHSPRSLPPIVGVMWTLVLEWAAELNAVHCTQVDGIEPITKQMFWAHHIDEVRHITFGRRLCEDYFTSKSVEELTPIRNLFKPAIGDVLEEFKYTEQISDLTSFEFPIHKTDLAAIRAVRASENNTRLNAVRFKEIIDWLTRLDLMPERIVPLGMEPVSSTIN
ncbi:MAG: diiron oxygenase [Burkholderiaceae bacterium]|nr:diiron oxygenase [Burkholderiaceae bacterium]